MKKKTLSSQKTVTGLQTIITGVTMSNSIYNDKKHELSEQYDNTAINDSQFEPLLTIDEAGDKLQQLVKSFFENGESMFINVSTGFGKTTAVLKMLRKIPPNKNVLILSPRHELAEEIINKYNKIPHLVVDNTLTPFEKMLKHNRVYGLRKIVHIKGKELMCENTGIMEQFKNTGISIPLNYCKNKCAYNAEKRCSYIQQFNEPYNIRVMTHDELRNEHQSAWFYGSSTGYNPQPIYDNYKPDYIIVDEDWLRNDNHVASMESEFDSIRKIINLLNDGTELSEAIQNFSLMVRSDYKKAKDIEHPSFHHAKQYIDDSKEYKAKLYDFKMLKVFYDFLKSGDDSELSRMKIHNKRLQYFRMKNIAERYQDVPTLFLDATSNEEIVKETIGDIDFHSIMVKPDKRINVHQTDFNVSRDLLAKGDNLDYLVDYLKILNAKYDKVGVITYKNVSFDNGAEIDYFDEWLKNETGIELCGHFGDIRGVDEFEDVDCLVIAGFHFIPLHEIENYAHAVFGEQISNKWIWNDTPIRMKDGSEDYFSNREYVDNRMEMVKQYFCHAETKQAVGRVRMIHTKKPKDIYLLTNESMGGDVEITDFIRKQEIVRKVKYDDAIAKLKKIGYCRDKAADLRSLGLDKSWVKNEHDDIEFAFVSDGIQRATISFTDKHRNKKNPVYYVSDNDIFDMYLREINATVVTCDTTA